jgi:riboflavin synthase
MFTGIIEKTAKVSSIDQQDKGSWLTLSLEFKDLTLGESISINGVCLTLAESSNSLGRFFISEETLSKTNLSKLSLYSIVNMERALLPTTRLSGHIVQGHVDTTISLHSIEAVGDSHEMKFKIPQNLCKYVVTKGSVALNGVSLTANSTTPLDQTCSILSVMIIPHTWKHTNLSHLQPGDLVNLEIDILAKYVEQLCQP